MNKSLLCNVKPRLVFYTIAFFLLLSASPSHAMNHTGEIDYDNATHTIACICKYPPSDQWDSWPSNVAYTVSGAFLGLLLPLAQPVVHRVYANIKANVMNKWNEFRAQRLFRP